MPMRAWKFRLYPNKVQCREMQAHLRLSKNLWNDMLELTRDTYATYGKFSTATALNQLTKTSGLYSQVAQDVFRRLNKAICCMVGKRRKGLKAGFPRFKSIDHMKSMTYPQFGFSLRGKMLRVTPFGEINIRLHREVTGDIRTLTLKREASGKWHAILTAEEEPKPFIQNNGTRVGMDLGLASLATLSDGTTIKNPRHLKKYEKQLAKRQRNLSRKKNGSCHRQTAKKKAAILHEKVRNTRWDFLHKLSRQMVRSHSLIALEDLDSAAMARQKYGKQINDAGWAGFADMLCYKAEEAGCKVVFVDARNTSKECSGCGELVRKGLWERQHNCQSCGLSINRDLNAAINILNRATGGTPGSNACGDVTKKTSMKQDAQHLSAG
ncbi:MAG: RNA-guided endonuclease TnpB family protein [Candidatus Micrarchaeota archaeon]